MSGEIGLCEIDLLGVHCYMYGLKTEFSFFYCFFRYEFVHCSNVVCFSRNTLTMIPDTNDIVSDSVPEKKNTSFICGVIEGSC